MQVLAYSNLARSQRVVCCLVYPCSLVTWESLRQRGRMFHQAELPNRGRQVQIWLTALPISAAVDRFAEPLIERLREQQIEQASI